MEDKNIIELLTSINTKLGVLIKSTEDKKKKTVVNIPELCRRLNVTRGFLENHPWLQPNLGKSDYPGNKKWDAETVDRWFAIPVEERKSLWEKQAGEMLETLEAKIGVNNGSARH